MVWFEHIGIYNESCVDHNFQGVKRYTIYINVVNS